MDNYSYNREFQRFDLFDQRFYSADGETFFPSTTHVLKVYPKDDAYFDWLKSMGKSADTIFEKAGKEGTATHDLIDMFLKNPNTDFMLMNDSGVPDHEIIVWDMAQRAMEFFKAVPMKVISTEQNLISANMKLGGTLDLRANFRGERWIVDYKTSNNIHKIHYIQLAVYAKLWNDLHPDDQIEKCGILWLKADTKGESNIGKPTEPTVRKLPTQKDPIFKKEPVKKKAPVRKQKDTDNGFAEKMDEWNDEYQKKLDEWVVDCDERREACETEYEEKLKEYRESAKQRTLDYNNKLYEWEQTKPIQGKRWQLKEISYQDPDTKEIITGVDAINHYYKLYRYTRAIWNEENPNYKPYNKRVSDRLNYKPLSYDSSNYKP